MRMTSSRHSPFTRRSRASAAAIVVSLAFASEDAWVRRTDAQTFRAAVDLIAVDVQVFDRQGLPIETLSPDQFTVTIDGRKRRVLSASLAKYELGSTAADLATPPAALAPNPISLSGPTGDGRTFIVAFDTASFRSVDIDTARRAADRFTQHLLPDDAVGVFPLPDGPYIAPTTSRSVVSRAIASVSGRKAASPSHMDMAIEQMVDITAAASTQSMPAVRQTVGKMVSNSVEDTPDENPIECPGTNATCTEQAIAEATSLATAIEEEVFQGIQGLDTLLRRLRETPVRKTVILFSGGMPVADRFGGRPSIGREVRLLGEQAAYANATIHTVYFDTNMVNEFSVDSRRPKSSTGRTRIINTRALAEFTEPSGGALLEVGLGPGDSQIDKLVGQISTYYVLGVEPDARDRDGRPHRLQVKVDAKNAQLRSRELVVVPKSGN
jgi:VWFA-related protein